MEWLTENLVVLVVVAVVFGGRLFRAVSWLAQRATSQPSPVTAQRQGAAPMPRPTQRQAAVAAISDARKKRAALLVQRAEGLAQRAAQLATEVRRERPNRRFCTTLEGWVPGRLAVLREAVRVADAGAEAGAEIGRGLDHVEQVLDEIDELVRQRRDPTLLPMLGDADTLAEACYAPVIDFCRAEDLPLTSGHPATQLTDFDLSIWVGFIPTSVAPIFLPPDFFVRAAWWPALAHEIGHDFMASVAGLEERLRRDLDLPGAAEGARPLVLDQDGLSLSEVRRLFGGWLEEIFCDVFGTLMCGPAYVATMIELFSVADNPQEVVRVAVAPGGRGYDPHPPRHLRLLLSCMVLERAGFHADRKRLLAAWGERHAAAGADLSHVLVPTYGVVVRIEVSYFTQLAAPIIERLYAGPLDALAGRGLTAVSGLDYGPHEHAEAQRALSALRAGQVPAVRDPRAVVAGVVLAALVDPAIEAKALAWGRAAIPALGTAEHVPGAYDQKAYDQGAYDQRAEVAPASVSATAALLADAMVLREVLGPPRALRPRR